MAITKQKLIDSGMSESCISIETCDKCRGILVGQKPDNLKHEPYFICVDCGTRYKMVRK